MKGARSPHASARRPPTAGPMEVPRSSAPEQRALVRPDEPGAVVRRRDVGEVDLRAGHVHRGARAGDEPPREEVDDAEGEAGAGHPDAGDERPGHQEQTPSVAVREDAEGDVEDQPREGERREREADRGGADSELVREERQHGRDHALAGHHEHGRDADHQQLVVFEERAERAAERPRYPAGGPRQPGRRAGVTSRADRPLERHARPSERLRDRRVYDLPPPDVHAVRQ